jgi:hypothetical protein
LSIELLHAALFVEVIDLVASRDNGPVEPVPLVIEVEGVAFRFLEDRHGQLARVMDVSHAREDHVSLLGLLRATP